MKPARQQRPLLANKLNMPFAIALFVGNIFSVGMTGFMVPWIASRMGWWLNPTRNVRANLLGAGLIRAIYLACVFLLEVLLMCPVNQGLAARVSDRMEPRAVPSDRKPL
jgi:hypothetical protein